MSVVTLQLGQCGNQIGGELFKSIIADTKTEQPDKNFTASENASFCQTSTERFFSVGQNEKLEARAVMVDMEPKVIAATLETASSSGKWSYPSKAGQWSQKRGSGNNWAHGFCVHGPRASEAVLDLVQSEVEKCDHFGGFLALMSLAGGTGSGVGAYISELLRDHYPHCFLVNQVVWPYKMGEVIVQNYNAILTLSHLYQVSDALITMDNDSLHQICSRLLAIKKVSFEDLNQVISHKLAGLLQPVKRNSGEDYIHNHLGAVLQNVVAQPEYKLVTVQDIPHTSQAAQAFTTHQWPGLLRHLRQMLIASAPMEEGINWQVKATARGGAFNHSVSNLLLLRGQDVTSADSSAFADPRLYPEWLPGQCAFEQWTSSRRLLGHEKSATLLSNSQAPVNILEPIIDKAWSMMSARAYVHQYVKHGLSEEDFLDSFASLEQVLASYKQLSEG